MQRPAKYLNMTATRRLHSDTASFITSHLLLRIEENKLIDAVMAKQWDEKLGHKAYYDSVNCLENILKASSGHQVMKIRDNMWRR